MFSKRIQRHIFLFAVAVSLSFVLVSCGSPGEEPTASLPTSIPLATVAPAATETAESTPTAALPVETTPADPNEPAPLPEKTFTIFDSTITLPEGAALYFSQEGGFAGLTNHWFIYADGTIVNTAGQTSQVTAEEVTSALDAIEQSGFYDLDQPKPSDVCCDFFHYTLIARDGSQSNAISLSEGEPDLPVAFSQSVAVMLAIVQNSYPSQ